jgi:hypothetical protein
MDPTDRSPSSDASMERSSRAHGRQVTRWRTCIRRLPDAVTALGTWTATIGSLTDPVGWLILAAAVVPLWVAGLLLLGLLVAAAGQVISSWCYRSGASKSTTMRSPAAASATSKWSSGRRAR